MVVIGGKSIPLKNPNTGKWAAGGEVHPNSIPHEQETEPHTTLPLLRMRNSANDWRHRIRIR
jgi:hypothetical protein